MPRKPRETPEDGTPNPPRDPKGIAITLQPAELKLLRMVAAQTKLTQGGLRSAIERSPGVAKAVQAELRKQWEEWREDIMGSNPFAGLDREKEGLGG